MKRMTLLLVCAAAVVAAAGCGDKPPVAKPTPPAAQTPEPAAEQPPAAITNNQQVTPGIAVSSDLAALCNIKAPPTELNPQFDYDKDELSKDDRAVLDQIATCLTSGPGKGRSVSLIGRADPRGTEEYNLGLGSRRASSVSQYLGRLGVADAQMTVTTRGALDATGTDEAGWKQDRRVDVQLKS